MSAPNPIQERVKTQLQKNLYLTTPVAIPILTVDMGSIENLVFQAITAPSVGIAITVLIPYGSNPEPHSGAVNLDSHLEISVAESFLINRSATGIQKPGYEVIRKIIRTYQPDGQGGLHHWQPGAPFTRLEFADFDEVELKVRNASALVYRAIFNMREMLS